MLVERRHTWWIWSIETQSMSGMYTMLPPTQVLRAGEKKKNEGKRGDWDGFTLFASHKTGAVTGAGQWGQHAAGTFSANVNKAENKELSFVMNDGNNLHLVHAVVVCIWQKKRLKKKTSISFATLQCGIIKCYYVINHRCRSHCGESIQEEKYQYRFSKDNSDSGLK